MTQQWACHEPFYCNADPTKCDDDIPYCGPPNIINSDVATSCDQVMTGKECNFECDTGHIRLPRRDECNPLVCEFGYWPPTNQLPECADLTVTDHCTAPNIPNSNVTTVCAAMLPGETCFFECDENFYKIGPDPVCNAGGTWTDLPTCKDVSGTAVINCDCQYGVDCLCECPSVGDCLVDCGLGTSCSQAIISCPVSASECTIYCEGTFECDSIEVRGSGGPVNMHCVGIATCKESILKCPPHHPCELTCEGTWPCQNLAITRGSAFRIDCASGNGCTLCPDCENLHGTCGSEWICSDPSYCIQDYTQCGINIPTCQPPAILNSDSATVCANIDVESVCMLSCTGKGPNGIDNVQIGPSPMCDMSETWGALPLCIEPVYCTPPTILNSNADSQCAQILAETLCDITCESSFETFEDDPYCSLGGTDPNYYGTWSNLPACNPITYCPDLTIPNTQPQDQAAGPETCAGYRDGETCDVACIGGYRQIGANPICAADGNWTNVPVCQDVVGYNTRTCDAATCTCPADSPCLVDCSDDLSNCYNYNQVITCPDNHDCVVICENADDCYGTTINAGAGATTTLYCITENACDSVTLSYNNQANNSVVLYCSEGQNACYSGVVICPSYQQGACEIDCFGQDACVGLTFTFNTAAFKAVCKNGGCDSCPNCLNHPCDEEFLCADPQFCTVNPLDCATNIPLCSIPDIPNSDVSSSCAAVPTGSWCDFSCNTGFIQLGDDPGCNIEIWDVVLPECGDLTQITHCTAPVIPNGKISTLEIDGCAVRLPGQTCAAGCDEFLLRIGPEPLCGADGTWQMVPNCLDTTGMNVVTSSVGIPFVVCPDGADCVINCKDDYCYQLHLWCPRTNHKCYIVCDGYQRCFQSTFLGGGGDLEVFCGNEYYSCQSTVLNCPPNRSCKLDCDSADDHSCAYMDVNTEYSVSQVACNENSLACNFCPECLAIIDTCGEDAWLCPDTPVATCVDQPELCIMNFQVCPAFRITNSLNAVACPSYLAYGEECIIGCADNTQLSGGANPVCQVDGTWDLNNLVTCALPGFCALPIILFSDVNLQCLNIAVGDTCDITCDEDYEQTLLDPVCEEGGIWKTNGMLGVLPACIPILYCPPLGIDHSTQLTDCTKIVLGYCVVTCDPGFQKFGANPYCNSYAHEWDSARPICVDFTDMVTPNLDNGESCPVDRPCFLDCDTYRCDNMQLTCPYSGSLCFVYCVDCYSTTVYGGGGPLDIFCYSSSACTYATFIGGDGPLSVNCAPYSRVCYDVDITCPTNDLCEITCTADYCDGMTIAHETSPVKMNCLGSTGCEACTDCIYINDNCYDEWMCASPEYCIAEPLLCGQNIPICPDLDIPFSTNSLSACTNLQVGQGCDVECMEGYFQVGDDPVCTMHGWGDVMECGDLAVLVHCADDPGIPNSNSVHECGPTLHSTSCDIMCDEGYTLIGAVPYCDGTGNWGAIPTCKNLAGWNVVWGSTPCPEGAPCFVDCSNNRCHSDTLRCPTGNYECEIFCNGAQYCHSGIFYGGGGPTTIQCLGSQSCLYGQFFGGTGPFTVSCHSGGQICLGAVVTCPTDAACHLLCQDESSSVCSGISLNLPQTGPVKVDCGANMVNCGNCVGCQTQVDTCGEQQWMCTGPTYCESSAEMCGVDVPSCLPPEVPNSNIYSACPETITGDPCQFDCDIGYTQIGQDIVCNMHEQWIGDTPFCVEHEYHCPSLSSSDIPFTDVGTQCVSTLAGQFCDITCIQDYEMIGHDPFCEQSGVWSTFPECVPLVYCPTLSFENSNTICQKVVESGTCDIQCEYLLGYSPVNCYYDGDWQTNLPICMPPPHAGIVQGTCDGATCSCAATGDCTIDCGSEDCEGLTVNCPASGASCTVICDSTYSCTDAIINSGGGDLYVFCDGYRACDSATINGGTGSLIVNCDNGYDVCVSTKVNCPPNNLCDVACGDNDCTSMVISRSTTKAVRVQCYDDSCSDCNDCLQIHGVCDVGQWLCNSPEYCTNRPETCQNVVPQCSTPDVPNSNVAIACPSLTNINGGCLITCDNGYNKVGGNPICSDYGWEGEPVCEQQCNPISIVDSDAAVACQTTLRNSECDFSCSPGFYIDGSKPFCNPDGTWNNIPTCEGFCSPPEILNSDAVVSCAEIPKGGTCLVNCDYTSYQTGANPTCDASGVWGTLPICEPYCQSFDVENSNSLLVCSHIVPGFTCDFTCSDGWASPGESAVCSADGTWQLPLPECGAPCGPVDIPNSNSALACDKIPRLGECDVECDHGFYQVGADPGCDIQGVWNAANFPTCEPACPIPVIANSDAENTCSNVEPGFGCTVMCNYGYTKEGDDPVCDGSKVWGVLPQCTGPNFCVQLYVDNSDSLMGCFEHNINTACQVTCDDDYEFADGDSDPFCGSDGQWSNIPTCVPINYCLDLNVANSNSVSVCLNIPADTTCDAFKCNDQFQQDAYGNPQCNSNGFWVNPLPSCNPIVSVCPSLDIPTTNSLEVCNNIGFDLSCTDLECPYGDKLSTGFPLCTNGVWTNIPTCVVDFIVCDPLDVPHSDSLTACAQIADGGHCTVGCVGVYILNEGVEEPLCDAGSWLHIPTCDEPIQGEICDNNVDDNANGDIDCDDAMCAEFVSCQSSWSIGSWESCSSVTGIRTRTVVCVDYNGLGIDDNQCLAVHPDTEYPCTGTWDVENWGACISGVQIISMQCISVEDETVIPDERCSEREDTRTCGQDPRWVNIVMGSCNPNTGTRTATALCKDEWGNILGNEKCDSSLLEEYCTWIWYESGFGECIDGKRTQEVTCRTEEDNVELNSSIWSTHCAGNQPSETANCAGNEICDNGIDDDTNGYTDCGDIACLDDEYCNQGCKAYPEDCISDQCVEEGGCDDPKSRTLCDPSTSEWIVTFVKKSTGPCRLPDLTDDCVAGRCNTTQCTTFVYDVEVRDAQTCDQRGTGQHLSHWGIGAVFCTLEDLTCFSSEHVTDAGPSNIADSCDPPTSGQGFKVDLGQDPGTTYRYTFEICGEVDTCESFYFAKGGSRYSFGENLTVPRCHDKDIIKDGNTPEFDPFGFYELCKSQLDNCEMEDKCLAIISDCVDKSAEDPCWENVFQTEMPNDAHVKLAKCYQEAVENSSPTVHVCVTMVVLLTSVIGWIW